MNAPHSGTCPLRWSFRLWLSLFACATATTVAAQDPPFEFRNRPYEGVVTAVTKTSITVIAPERVQEVISSGPFPDSPAVVTREVLPAEPPRTFAASAVLATGGVPREPRRSPRGYGYQVSEAQMYRLSDVRVGDWVTVTYARVGGADVCDHISIYKRPGGRVPPLPDGVEVKRAGWPEGVPYIRYHERMNAHWDLVDRGIPYPAWFGPQRRFPTAPMPRPVNPK